MSKIDILFRIELLEDQLENIKHSGHFTEKEIDMQSHPLELELSTLKRSFVFFGMTYESYKEGSRIHKHYFSQITSPALQNTWNALGINLNTRG